MQVNMRPMHLIPIFLELELGTVLSMRTILISSEVERVARQKRRQILISLDTKLEVMLLMLLIQFLLENGQVQVILSIILQM